MDAPPIIGFAGGEDVVPQTVKLLGSALVHPRFDQRLRGGRLQPGSALAAIAAATKPITATVESQRTSEGTPRQAQLRSRHPLVLRATSAVSNSATAADAGCPLRRARLLHWRRLAPRTSRPGTAQTLALNWGVGGFQGGHDAAAVHHQDAIAERAQPSSSDEMSRMAQPASRAPSRVRWMACTAPMSTPAWAEPQGARPGRRIQANARRAHEPKKLLLITAG